MIIDFHVHCFPDKIAPKAISALSSCSGLYPYTDGTIDTLKTSMRTSGIDISIVQNIATKPTQTINVNNWAIEINCENIIAFGSIHPLFEDWKEELVRISNAGLKGIKLHPDYQNFYVDNENIFPLYESAFELGLIILFHAGKDIGLPEPTHCTPKLLRTVIDRFPGANIIAAHMGGYDFWDEAERYLVGTDIYFDTSYTMGWIDKNQFLRMAKNHSSDRILFGTDSPWTNQQTEINKLNDLYMGKSTADAILAGNACKLLKL